MSKIQLPKKIIQQVFSHFLPESLATTDFNATEINLNPHNCDIAELNSALFAISWLCEGLNKLSLSYGYQSYMKLHSKLNSERDENKCNQGNCDCEISEIYYSSPNGLATKLVHTPQMKPISAIDCDKLYFPKLKFLSISGIPLSVFRLSNKNVPNLTTLEIDRTFEPIDTYQVTGLEKLKRVFIQNTEILDRYGFEQFMWLSPNLEEFESDRLVNLVSQIWYLPKMKKLTLESARGLQNLIILYAPQLEFLSIEDTYTCEFIRLFNCPQITNAGFKDAMEIYQGKIKRINDCFDEHWNKWKRGVYGIPELLDFEILEEDELEEYGSQPFQDSETVREIVAEELEYERDQTKQSLFQSLVQSFTKLHLKNDSQPKVKLNCNNVKVPQDTFQHLTSHDRIVKRDIIGYANLLNEQMNARQMMAMMGMQPPPERRYYNVKLM